MAAVLNPLKYYRLPWSLTDNGISWLEVTTSCNLACKGCYRPKNEGHKSLEEIAEDLAVFKRERKSDCMSIAGGDPLVHPKIVEIVRMVREGGWKPVINTNGLALTPKLLGQLKAAGAFGFTFHIDTSQVRKDSRATSEMEHTPLREKFARMLAEEGGLVCAFNQTITSETLGAVPEIVRWAKGYPDIINTVVFILYREPRLLGDFEFYAKGKKVDLYSTYEKSDNWSGKKLLKAADIVEKIREADPLYEPSAYLNGTNDPESMKWLIGVRMGSSDDTYGYVSPRFMQLVQEGSHMMRGKWLSYSSPDLLSAGRSTMLALATIDKTMRQSTARYLKAAARNPRRLLGKVHMQAFTIIQPVDALADGRFNMCDGCPDMTVYKGKMYWSCRLEEVKQFGAFVSAIPRSKPVVAEQSPRVIHAETNAS